MRPRTMQKAYFFQKSGTNSRNMGISSNLPIYMQKNRLEVKTAMQLWLETAKEIGREIPAPQKRSLVAAET